MTTNTIEYKGLIEVDSNFYTVYTANSLITVARNTGKAAELKVGERGFWGGKLTAEMLASYASNAHRVGTVTVSYPWGAMVKWE